MEYFWLYQTCFTATRPPFRDPSCCAVVLSSSQDLHELWQGKRTWGKVKKVEKSRDCWWISPWRIPTGLLGGGVSNIFGIFTPIPEEMIQFDEHIFQVGWNHQLGLPIPWECLEFYDTIIYLCMEAKVSLCLKGKEPPNKAKIPIKTRGPIWVPGTYTNICAIYIIWWSEIVFLKMCP